MCCSFVVLCFRCVFLPFLVDIHRFGGCLSSSVYHRCFFKDLATPYGSCSPSSSKKGLIFFHYNHCFDACILYKFFHAELEKPKTVFIKNGYLVKVIDRCFVSFLKKVFAKSSKIVTVPERIVDFSSPFGNGRHFTQV